MSTITHLKSEDAYNCVLPTAHIKAMVAAMKATREFTITEDYDDAEVVNAYHTASRSAAYAAIHRGNGLWDVRHHRLLFA
jgi:hypothetical protein